MVSRVRRIGAVAGFVDAVQKWGKLGLAEVFQPAIELAEKGLVCLFAPNSDLA